MVTGETRRAAEAAGDECVFRFLDQIVVKGRRQPAEMHEIVCLRRELTDETTLCLEHYADGMGHYLARRWNEAATAFEKSAATEPNRSELNPDAHATPSLVMLERVGWLRENPPGPDWDGVYAMQTK
jgi:adenylate cyclase